MIGHFPFLSTIVFLPLFGGLLALASWRRPSLVRWISLITMLVDLALVLCALAFVDAGLKSGGGWMLMEDFRWIDAFGIRYTLRLDGISLLLALLTTFLGIMCVLVSWRDISEKVGSFHFFILLTQTAILGIFLSTDLFLFYIFWELQLIPVYFLIGVWGHGEQTRIRATIKFFLYSIFGSLLMLLAIIGAYLIHGEQTGTYTFSLYSLIHTSMARSTQLWLYAAFLLAFAIKVPVFPFHTWLPDAHTEAPTAGSVILAGLLLKTGVYGIFRFAFALFPIAAKMSVPLLLVLGLIGLFYASWIALAQTDMKRLVAYSSISHMGMIVIGLAVWEQMTISGAVLQMLNHGITTSALFIMVGMLSERTHSRDFADYGGLWKKMPVFSGFFLLFGMAFIALPGTNNFAGEILILLGTFRTYPIIAVIAFVIFVFGLIYTLRLIQDALFGEPKKELDLWDVTPRETLILASLAALILFVGLYPMPFLNLLQYPVQLLYQQAPQIAHAGLM
jgi:NADH-quinone oxidoreductase subunit M